MNLNCFRIQHVSYTHNERKKGGECGGLKVMRFRAMGKLIEYFATVP